MTSIKHTMVLIAALAGAVPAVALAGGKPKYYVVEPSDVGAAFAADFAVKEKGETLKNGLKLGELVKAERLDVGKMGGKFRLCLKVLGGEDGTAASFAQAEVSVDDYSNHKLLSWAAKKTCGQKK